MAANPAQSFKGSVILTEFAAGQRAKRGMGRGNRRINCDTEGDGGGEGDQHGGETTPEIASHIEFF